MKTIIKSPDTIQIPRELWEGRRCYRCKADIPAGTKDYAKIGSIVVTDNPDEIEIAWEYFCWDCGTEIARFSKVKPEKASESPPITPAHIVYPNKTGYTGD